MIDAVELRRPNESEMDLHATINDRALAQAERPGVARRGSRVGWDSDDARAQRKGWHDVRSGRITPESSLVVPVHAQYDEAWRTRGLPNPWENAQREPVELEQGVEMVLPDSRPEN